MSADVAEHKSALSGRTFYLSILFWLIFCAIAIPIRGIRWDENLEFAQILTGHVAHPADHPMSIYAHNAFSLQTYLSALQLWLIPDPVFLSATRNFLALAFDTISVFVFVTFLTGRCRWGHTAVLFILSRTFDTFAGYDLWAVWPEEFSNGAVGRGWMFLAFCFVLARHWRPAYFMIGVMPSVHLGQLPALLGFAGLHTIHSWFSAARPAIKRALLWGVAGLALCVCFWIVQRPFAAPLPTEGPYYSEADPHTIWKYYTVHDVHRMMPGLRYKYFSSHVVMVMALAIAIAAAWREWTTRKAPGPWTGILIVCAGSAATVWITMAIHVTAGHDIWPPLLMWMPYRLALQHLFPLLFFMVMGVLCGPGKNKALQKAGVAIVATMLLFQWIKPLLSAVAGEELYVRYFTDGDFIIAFFCGAAGAALCAQMWTRQRGFVVTWIALCTGLVGWLALYHQFAAAAISLGFAFMLVDTALLKGIDTQFLNQTAKRFGPATLVVLALITLGAEWRNDKPLRRDPFDAQVVEYLKSQGDEDAILLTDNYAPYPQARTGHAILVHWQTAGYVTYMPTLGPSLQKLYGDVYGIPFGVSENDGHEYQPGTWQATWSARTQGEWQTLSQSYDFHYVWTPQWIPIDLPEVLSGHRQKLYQVPRPPG
jgi:hypothetical protein